tara:strand:+ start:1321 stop:1605 length:285 start_codon:yes stop_codon:yes gene_type:complete
MELIYILYRPYGKQPQYKLLFPLGSRNGKLCAISTKETGKGEINCIRANKDKLATLSLEQKLVWLKNNCPIAYKKGYKEIFEKNYSIVSKHPIS